MSANEFLATSAPTCRNSRSPTVVSVKEQAMTTTLFRILTLMTASVASAVAWAGEYFEA
jgi:hypothetical protein